MLCERFEFTYHEMLTQIPLFSHRKPERVLILGGGDGGCIRECLKHKSIKSIDLCDLDKKVILASKKYLPFVASSLISDRVNIHFYDGYNFLKQQSKNMYDIILVDSTDPNGKAATLFSQRFYRIASKRLRKNGIFCTIGTTPFYESRLIRMIDRRLRSVFRYTKHYLAFIPMYQSGCWSFVISSDCKIPHNAINKMQIDHNSFKYYNKNIHRAAFALPSFYKKLLPR